MNDIRHFAADSGRELESLIRFWIAAQKKELVAISYTIEKVQYASYHHAMVVYRDMRD